MMMMMMMMMKPGGGCVGLDWQLYGNLPRACPTQTDYYKPVLKTMVQQASEVLSHLERSPVSPFSWPAPRCHGRVCVSESSKPLCLGAASCGETLFFPSWLEVKLREPACQGMVEVHKKGLWVVKSCWHSNVVCWWPGCTSPNQQAAMLNEKFIKQCCSAFPPSSDSTTAGANSGDPSLNFKKLPPRRFSASWKGFLVGRVQAWMVLATISWRLPPARPLPNLLLSCFTCR